VCMNTTWNKQGWTADSGWRSGCAMTSRPFKPGSKAGRGAAVVTLAPYGYIETYVAKVSARNYYTPHSNKPVPVVSPIWCSARLVFRLLHSIRNSAMRSLQYLTSIPAPIEPLFCINGYADAGWENDEYLDLLSDPKVEVVC